MLLRVTKVLLINLTVATLLRVTKMLYNENLT